MGRGAFSRNHLGALKQVLHAVAKGQVTIRVLTCGLSQRMLTLTAAQSAGARHDGVATAGRQMLHI